MSASKKRSNTKSTPKPQPEDLLFSDDEEEQKQGALNPTSSTTTLNNNSKRANLSAWEDLDDKDFEMDISKVARLRKPP